MPENSGANPIKEMTDDEFINHLMPETAQQYAQRTCPLGDTECIRRTLSLTQSLEG